MNIQEAVDAPRIHHQWLPDVLFVEKGGLQEDTRVALEHRGYTIREVDSMCNAQAIMIDPNGRTRFGGSDPRGEGLALGHKSDPTMKLNVPYLNEIPGKIESGLDNIIH